MPIFGGLFGNRNRNSNTTVTNEPSRPVSRVISRQLTETGPMLYYANDTNGLSDKEFIFDYRKMSDGSWRAYIIKMPSLRGRASDLHSTHRLSDGGNYYVCWDTRLFSLKECQTVSRRWADCIVKYIATGERFG